MVYNTSINGCFSYNSSQVILENNPSLNSSSDELRSENEKIASCFQDRFSNIAEAVNKSDELSFNIKVEESAFLKGLSQELLVPENKLREKAAQGEAVFNRYINKKREKYGKVLEISRLDYHNISRYYIPDEKAKKPGQIKAKHGAHRSFSEEILMKIIRKSNLELAASDSNEQNGVAVKLKHHAKWHILAKRENGQLHVARWSGEVKLMKDHHRYLGRGGFGIAQKVDLLSKGKIATIKFSLAADHKNQKMADEGIVNERLKTTLIHEGGIKVGLQAPSHAFFNIVNGPTRKEILIGNLQKYYNCGSMADAIKSNKLDCKKMSKKQVLLMIRELYSGLRELHSDEKAIGTIIHGDIKPGNIFVDKTKNKGFSFVIADLGDAKAAKSELLFRKDKNQNPLGTCATVGYFTEGDYWKLTSAMKDDNHDKWVELQKKRDIYATAASIWFAVTGEEPYSDFYGGSFPITHRGIDNEQTVLRICGSAVAGVLKSSLREIPHKRPSIEEVLEVVDNELQGMN